LRGGEERTERQLLESSPQPYPAAVEHIIHIRRILNPALV